MSDGFFAPILPKTSLIPFCVISVTFVFTIDQVDAVERLLAVVLKKVYELPKNLYW